MTRLPAVEVVPVRSPRRLSQFLQVAKRIYAADPCWIAPLDLERRVHFSPKSNPFFQHAEAQLFLALQNGRPVGRISAHVDRLHLERYGDATGQFGFIEAIDHQPVFAALFSHAEGWLKDRGLKRIQGPFNFSINDECGLLVEGFATPPAVMMGHARPYYGERISAEGYAKAKDLIAYDYDMHRPVPRALAAIVAKNRGSGKITVRALSKRRLDRDLAMIVDIFNDAWSANWNFVPMTGAEIQSLGNLLKYLVDEGHVAIAFYEDEPAAMIVTLPDLNRMWRDLGGRLLPFGWAKLIWRLKMKTHEAFRVPLLGVKQKYRSSSLGTILALAVIDAVSRFHRSRGTLNAELSWILEDNMPMRRLIEALGAEPYKTYRVYEKSLA
jgi:GNAT superfamily N-acetyltransferase